MNSLTRISASLAGRFRVENEVGQGGMATVYLAHDVKHDRKVALKVLKPELAAVLGAERFVQEITTTAALQHPHILPLFDSGEADGFLYYVMPFIEGETLRARLDRETQLGVDEAVRITTDVADALQYAHEHGVIHRDIKPENILLANGRPMVADFGIALALSAAAGGRMTETGLSLGTPHYMSPEQATAEKDISARSDLYSLGSVLYEMLTGQPPHLGGSAQQIIMKIITETPQSVASLRKSVPPNVTAAVAKSLEKLPADRFDSAAKFAEALNNADFSTQYASHAKSRSGFLGTSARRVVATFATVAGVATALAAWGWLRSAPESPVQRLDLSLGEIAPNSDVAVSPDGSMIAVGGKLGAEDAIYLRRIDEPDFQKIPGTERGSRVSFSPNNQWIAFRRSPENSLVKVPITGGQAMTLVKGEELQTFDVHWGTDDQILLSGPQGAYTVSPAGGPPKHWEKVGGRWPFLLPDGSGILYRRGGNVSVLDFATDSSRVLIRDGWSPTYVQSGHLLYNATDGGLYAVPFDLGSHAVTGTPVRVLERVAGKVWLLGYSVSRNGLLVHHDGASELGGPPARTPFVMMDFDGRADTLRLPPGRLGAPRFSPDGRSIAYSLAGLSGNKADIYTFDLVVGANSQITVGRDVDNGRPLWSPDGKRLVFSRDNGNADKDLYIKASDNSTAEELVVSLPGNQKASAWLADGTIVFETDQAGNADLYTYSLAERGEARAYLEAPWNEGELTVSPDGTLAAFLTDETGDVDVWLRTWPDAEGKWRVSFGRSGGGLRWSPDGRYLYYWTTRQGFETLTRVRIDRSPSVVVHPAERLLTKNLTGSNAWDLHPDGKRFVIAELPGSPPDENSGPASAGDSRYLVVLNWFTELRAKTGQGAQR